MIWVGLWLTAALLLVAPGTTGMLKRVVRVYGIFFTIAFAVRGTLLAVFEPNPSSVSSFAISRLAIAGYQDGLAAVLPFAMASALAFYLAIWAGGRFLRAPLPTVRISSPTAASLFVVGALANLSHLVLGENAFTGRIGSIGLGITVAVLGALVLGSPWREHQVRLVVILSICEAALSVPAASKTPLLTALLFLYLDPRRPRISWRAGLLAGASILVAFTALQQLKPGSSLEGDNIFSRAFFSISGRLDGLYALTGAYFLGAGRYTPDNGFASALTSGLIPGWLQGSEKLLSGRLWGVNVYGVNNGVSYAEGLSGEGLAIGGVWGPMAWGLAGGVIVLVAVAATSSRFGFLQLAGIGFIGSTAIYERGLLGQAEQIGAALQCAAVVAILVVIARQLEATAQRQSFARTRRAPGAAVASATRAPGGTGRGVSRPPDSTRISLRVSGSPPRSVPPR